MEDGLLPEAGGSPARDGPDGALLELLEGKGFPQEQRKATANRVLLLRVPAVKDWSRQF